MYYTIRAVPQTKLLVGARPKLLIQVVYICVIQSFFTPVSQMHFRSIRAVAHCTTNSNSRLGGEIEQASNHVAMSEMNFDQEQSPRTTGDYNDTLDVQRKCKTRSCPGVRIFRAITALLTVDRFNAADG
jgi:hypothetical protein